jgi:hypothetical protein
LLVLALASAPSAFAQESPKDLVKKLSSASYAERERAALALEKLGKAAFPPLRDAIHHADLETRRRALVLMERIEDRVSVEQVIAATPIALDIKNETVSNALKRTTDRMGLPVGRWVDDDQKISITSGPLPYWQAWRQLRTAAKLGEIDLAAASGKLQSTAGPQPSLVDVPLVYRAPRIQFPSKPLSDRYREDSRSSMRVRVRWESLEKSFGPAKAPHAIFAVEVRPEPRLEISGLPSVQITKIVDADGNERKATSPQAFSVSDPLAVATGGIQFGGLVHLKALAWQGPPRPLKEVHGRVRMEVVTYPIVLELPGLTKANRKEVRDPQGVTLSLRETEIDDDGQLVVYLRLSNLDSLTPMTDKEKIVRVRPGLVAVRGAIDVAMERLKLRDDKGWLYTPLPKTEYRDVGKGVYEATIYFAPPVGRVEDFALVMTKAPRTLPVDVTFQVSDVPSLK